MKPLNDTKKDDLEPKLTTLGRSISSWTGSSERLETAVPGLTFFRRTQPTAPLSVLYHPCVCVIAQGTKRVMLGEEVFEYDAHHYLVSSVHLPTLAQVVEASEGEPCLGLVLKIDLREISKMMVEGDLPAPRAQQANLCMVSGAMTGPLLDAFQRLVDLLADERDIRFLAPSIQREIVYRLLVGDQGMQLRQLASSGSQSRQIAQAIDWLRSDFTHPLRVEEVASKAGMSTSTFHHHFRSMTGLSPLQFQKQVRLQEAKRLMLAEGVDAANAAFQVGYESPSQFSREYKRLFGAPPLSDINDLRSSSVRIPEQPN